MPLFANFRHRIQTNRLAHVKRNIIGQGQLTVSKGEEVQPQDILGRSSISAGFSATNVAKILGVSPKEGMKFLQKPIGKTIFKGELLALKKGMFGDKIVRAPTDGIVELYDEKSGELRLKFLPKETPLVSGVFGIVDNVDSQNGEVLIKTIVTEVFGMLGSGKERGGVLHILSKQGSLVNLADITIAMRQHILVAGSLIYGDALKRAVGFGLSGVICGGLNAFDYKSISGNLNPLKRIGSDIGISILATEGFGLIPIGEDIFKEILQYAEKFVFINGNSNQLLLPTASLDSILTLRKVSLPISKAPNIQPEITLGELKLGDKVRIIWPLFMGAQGKIVGIDKTPTLLESGISTVLLTIELPKQKIKVPYTNVEIIG